MAVSIDSHCEDHTLNLKLQKSDDFIFEDFIKLILTFEDIIIIIRNYYLNRLILNLYNKHCRAKCHYTNGITVMSCLEYYRQFIADQLCKLFCNRRVRLKKKLKN